MSAPTSHELAGQPAVERNRTRQSHQLTPFGVLAWCAPPILFAVIVVVATSGLWLNPGIPLFGDFIPPTTQYIGHISSVWDTLEHNGTISVDFRSAALFVPLSALAGSHVGDLRF